MKIWVSQRTKQRNYNEQRTVSLGTEFKFSSPDIPDIHEDQNFQFNFKAPVIKSEKVKEADAVAGYVTDEKEFMTPEEMTESDEEEGVRWLRRVGPLPQLHCQNEGGGGQESHPQDQDGIDVRAKQKGGKLGEAVMRLHKEKNDKQWLFSRVGSSSEKRCSTTWTILSKQVTVFVKPNSGATAWTLTYNICVTNLNLSWARSRQKPREKNEERAD